MCYFIVFVLCTISLSAQATDHAASNENDISPGPVVISELMWSGSSGSNADEWVELYNRSDITVDLTGWTLTRLSDGQDLIMLVFDETSIAPGQGRPF